MVTFIYPCQRCLHNRCCHSQKYCTASALRLITVVTLISSVSSSPWALIYPGFNLFFSIRRLLIFVLNCLHLALLITARFQRVLMGQIYHFKVQEYRYLILISVKNIRAMSVLGQGKFSQYQNNAVALLYLLLDGDTYHLSTVIYVARWRHLSSVIYVARWRYLSIIICHICR